MAVLSVKELLSRFDECDKLIQANRGKIINQSLAKVIYKLSKGGFRIVEERIDDDKSFVRMQRIVDEKYQEAKFDWNFFVVKGRLYDKLNMCD